MSPRRQLFKRTCRDEGGQGGEGEEGRQKAAYAGIARREKEGERRVRATGGLARAGVSWQHN